jgi:hypothetical protein
MNKVAGNTMCSQPLVLLRAGCSLFPAP